MSSLLKGLNFRLKNIGRVPICNCKRDRAPVFMGYSFILCWRCTSILFSLLGMRIFFDNNLQFKLMIKENIVAFSLLATILVIPTTIDGIRQYIFKKESTNKKRIITGFVAGYGIFLLKILTS